MSELVMTDEERQGVNMIRALQALANIDEHEARALSGWRGMAEWERERTRDAYNTLCAPKEGKDGGRPEGGGVGGAA
jgi:hypothetical protein